jgi:hypothetical protein
MANEAAPISAEAIARWYEGCDFSEDWTSNNFPVWTELLRPLRGAPVNILEIGSWEGRSALFFLNYLPNSRIVCVDTFAGGDEHRDNADWSAQLPLIEQRFDANLQRFKARVEKIKASSHAALVDLGLTKRRFDLVYVDGGHRAGDVYGDAILSWPLLNRRGIMIFDDYEWPHAPNERERPKMGVDAFLWNFMNQYSLVFRGYQLIVQKI